MIAFTVFCVVTAAVPAANQLLTGGWGAFLNRPPGVGGSPAQPDQAAKATPSTAAGQSP